MSVKLFESPVYFSEKGELYNYSGIPINVCAIASPLVEEGSGGSVDHPSMSRKYAVQTVVSADIPIYIKELSEVKDSLWVAPKGTKLQYGDKVIAQRSNVAKSGYVVLTTWDSIIPGRVIGEPSINYNLKAKTLSVKVDAVQIETGSAEKFRGFGKYRGNGGFLKNITVTKGADVIFDPNAPIEFVERLVGGEEYKTLMYVLNIIAPKMKNGSIVWNGVSYDNEAEVIGLIEKEAKRVTVKRWNLEPTIYAAYKALYGNDAEFEWDDANCGIVHHDVWAWIGTSVEIVEVPLTKVFMGKTRLFAEHVDYLGTQYPELYAVLKADIEQNQILLDKVLTNAESVDGEANLEKFVLVDSGTEIIPGDKFSIELSSEDGVVMVDSITVPEEYSLDFLRQLERTLKKAGFDGIVLQASDKHGDVYDFPINLEVFSFITGSVSHKAVRSLFQAFGMLEWELDDRNDSWNTQFYRYGTLIAGAVEIAVAESTALMAKGAKTSALAYTCRAASTLDASVGLGELHICADMAKFWNIEEGDFVVPGRIPMPGATVLDLVFNEAVPFGIVMFNAAMKHAIEEGDIDGDSCVLLVISPEGDLRMPKRGCPSVVPNLD